MGGQLHTYVQHTLRFIPLRVRHDYGSKRAKRVKTDDRNRPTSPYVMRSERNIIIFIYCSSRVKGTFRILPTRSGHSGRPFRLKTAELQTENRKTSIVSVRDFRNGGPVVSREDFFRLRTVASRPVCAVRARVVVCVSLCRIGSRSREFPRMRARRHRGGY